MRGSRDEGGIGAWRRLSHDYGRLEGLYGADDGVQHVLCEGRGRERFG